MGGSGSLLRVVAVKDLFFPGPFFLHTAPGYLQGGMALLSAAVQTDENWNPKGFPEKHQQFP